MCNGHVNYVTPCKYIVHEKQLAEKCVDKIVFHFNSFSERYMEMHFKEEVHAYICNVNFESIELTHYKVSTWVLRSTQNILLFIQP